MNDRKRWRLYNYKKGLVLNEQHFVQNPNLTSLVADLTTSQNILSENWKNKHQIHTKIESDRLKQAAEESVFIFKLRVTENLILEKQQALKETDSNESDESIIKEISENGEPKVLSKYQTSDERNYG